MLFRASRLGSALLMTMTMLFVFVLIIGAVGNLSQMNTSTIAVRRWQKQARFAGYAGLQDALSRCTANPAYNTPIAPTPLDGDPDTLYQVDIFNNFSGATGQYAPDNKTWVPPGAIYLYSIGTLRGRNAQGSGGYVAVAGIQRPRFDLALYCESGGIQLDNSNVVVWDPASPPVSQIAHVSSNRRTGLAIQSVNSNVQGKLICGPGLTTGSSISVSGGSNAGLETGVSSKVLTPFFSPVFPSATVPPVSGADYYLYAGGYGDVVVPAGTTLELAPTTGTGARVYTFRSLTLMPGANIKVTTTPEYPITVYCTNGMNLQGNNDVNWNSATSQPFDPQRLQLYFTGSAATALNINNCPHVSMVAAGKGMVASLNASEMWGSIMANSAHLTGSTLHYDMRLTGVMLDGQGEMALLNVMDVAPAEATQAVALTTTVASAAAAATGAPPPPPPGPPPAPPQPPPTGFVVAAAPAAPAAPASAPAAPASAPAAPASAPAAPASAPAAPASAPAAPASAPVAPASAPAAPASAPAAPASAPAAPASAPAAPASAPVAPASAPAAPASAPAAPASAPAAPASAPAAPASAPAAPASAPVSVPATSTSATGY